MYIFHCSLSTGGRDLFVPLSLSRRYHPEEVETLLSLSLNPDMLGHREMLLGWLDSSLGKDTVVYKTLSQVIWEEMSSQTKERLTPNSEGPLPDLSHQVFLVELLFSELLSNVTIRVRESPIQRIPSDNRWCGGTQETPLTLNFRYSFTEVLSRWEMERPVLYSILSDAGFILKLESHYLDPKNLHEVKGTLLPHLSSETPSR